MQNERGPDEHVDGRGAALGCREMNAISSPSQKAVAKFANAILTFGKTVRDGKMSFADAQAGLIGGVLECVQGRARSLRRAP